MPKQPRREKFVLIFAFGESSSENSHHFVAFSCRLGMASSSQPSGVVVWEWEERSKLWIPYEAAVAQFLEDSYSRCKQRASRNSTVSLGKCCSSLHCYEVDLVSMEQMNVGTGKESCIVQFLNLITFSSGLKY